MININEELYNKKRVKRILGEVDGIFKQHNFLSWEDLHYVNKYGELDLITLKIEICNIFKDEIDKDDMEVLNTYIGSLFWTFKDYNSHLFPGKVVKCKYAMRVKDDILRYAKELALKYGGLSVDD